MGRSRLLSKLAKDINAQGDLIRAGISGGAIDSSSVLALIDSDYISLRSAEGGLDSANVISLIDSDYVSLRSAAGGLDSGSVLALVDSDYVSLRSGSGGPLNVPDYTPARDGTSTTYIALYPALGGDFALNSGDTTVRVIDLAQNTFTASNDYGIRAGATIYFSANGVDRTGTTDHTVSSVTFSTNVYGGTYYGGDITISPGISAAEASAITSVGYVFVLDSAATQRSILTYDSDGGTYSYERFATTSKVSVGIHDINTVKTGEVNLGNSNTDSQGNYEYITLPNRDSSPTGNFYIQSASRQINQGALYYDIGEKSHRKLMGANTWWRSLSFAGFGTITIPHSQSVYWQCPGPGVAYFIYPDDDLFYITQSGAALCDYFLEGELDSDFSNLDGGENIPSSVSLPWNTKILAVRNKHYQSRQLQLSSNKTGSGNHIITYMFFN